MLQLSDMNTHALPPSIKKASSVIVTKSPYDDREYKYMELPNKMRVLLISDPNTDKAAACMAVNVGSLSDPHQLPGLAHFCEHMLFLGTMKYPTENAYSKFVLEHGGRYNACTSTDETCFAFDINPNHLDKALDIFAQFFIAPLFTESATDREISAIQAEHEKNSCKDTRRLYQLERSLSLPGHDYSRFLSGNRYSLAQSPCARNVDLRENLMEFHDTWYSANLMALVVLGKEPIDKLETLVTSLFGDVPNKDVPQPSWDDSPWVEAVLKKKTFVTPVAELNQLHLMWPIDDYSEFYKSRTHLLGHEGQGSLLSLLKKMGWVNRLTCGVSRPGKGFASLIISMDLTENGLGRVDDIVAKVYQYLRMLRSDEPQEWIFLENQALNNLHFRFKDKEQPYDYVMQSATNLFRYSPGDVLVGPYLLTYFEPVYIKEILGCLHPDNCRMFLVSRTYEPHCTDLERWYNTRFLCMDIPESTLQRWREIECDIGMTLPAANKYIATEFNIHPRPKDFSTVAPELLVSTELSRLWFLPDHQFGFPKAFVTFHIIRS
ncbi:Insulin-degrading enzyme, partial [Paragonimus heterotremus]